jgi:hypothetical protein
VNLDVATRSEVPFLVCEKGATCAFTIRYCSSDIKKLSLLHSSCGQLHVLCIYVVYRVPFFTNCPGVLRKNGNVPFF